MCLDVEDFDGGKPITEGAKDWYLRAFRVDLQEVDTLDVVLVQPIAGRP